MTAHKHAAMIKSKADNMDLVVLCKDSYDQNNKWQETSQLPIQEEFDYFLCLPQHKEACLYWLNGGEIEMQSDEDWVLVEMFKSTMPWHPLRIFMEDYTVIRIKPRKEKLWIAFNHENGNVYGSFVDEYHCTKAWPNLQRFEIEVEI